MSEFVLRLESITTAGWVFLCILGALTLALLAYQNHPARKADDEDTRPRRRARGVARARMVPGRSHERLAGPASPTPDRA